MRRGESSARHLNTRAGNEPASAEEIWSTWMLNRKIPVQNTHSAKNSWQHGNHDIAAVAGNRKSFPAALACFFVILYEIANNQDWVDQPSLAHRTSSRPRAASAAASRICAKDIPLALLAGERQPFSGPRNPGAREWWHGPLFNQVLKFVARF